MNSIHSIVALLVGVVLGALYMYLIRPYDYNDAQDTDSQDDN